MSGEKKPTYIDPNTTGSTGRTGGEGGGLKSNPDEWKTGDEPMTSAQKSYLHTLAREADEEAQEDLTKAEAAKEIERLREKLAVVSAKRPNGAVWSLGAKRVSAVTAPETAILPG